MLAAIPAFAANPSGPGYAGDIMGNSTGRYAGDAQRTFRLVRNGPQSTQNMTTAAAITAGNLVIWDTTTNPYGNDGVSVALTTTSGDSRVAGMAITAIPTRDASTYSVQGAMGVTTATEDVGQANWGWIQTYGKSAVVGTVAAGSPVVTVGEAICCGTTAGSYGGWRANNAGSYSGQGKCGFATTTAATSGTAYIFLMCE